MDFELRAWAAFSEIREMVEAADRDYESGDIFDHAVDADCLKSVLADHGFWEGE